MDWKLDSNGDLDTSDGDVAWVTGADAIAQHCSIRMKTFLGEYWLNERIGIDYFGKILVKNPDMGFVQSTFRRTVLGTPGVVDLLSFAMTLAVATRTLSITFRAETEEGPFDFSEEFILP